MRKANHFPQLSIKMCAKCKRLQYTSIQMGGICLVEKSSPRCNDMISRNFHVKTILLMLSPVKILLWPKGPLTHITHLSFHVMMSQNSTKSLKLQFPVKYQKTQMGPKVIWCNHIERLSWEHTHALRQQEPTISCVVLDLQISFFPCAGNVGVWIFYPYFLPKLSTHIHTEQKIVI